MTTTYSHFQLQMINLKWGVFLLIDSNTPLAKAKEIKSIFNTTDPDLIAQNLNIEVIERDFKKQKGVYMVIERNPFIFLKNDLHPVMRSIVLLHEIGHDLLHKEEAVKFGGFKEFNIFEMCNRRMEFEANIFAAEIMLSDDDMLEYIYQGYDI